MSERTVTLTMSVKEAEALSYAIADWMCWAGGLELGIAAADGWNSHYIPSKKELRDLNVAIKRLVRADDD